jgi:FlaA1/EpsC-like NDP-sugar epimerase
MLGPSQILGRDELESYPEGMVDTESYYVEEILPEKLRRDLEYVASASFLGDLKLLAHGLWATAYGAIKGKFLWQRRHRVALFLVDMGLTVVSCYLAFMIRYEFEFAVRITFFVYPLLITVATRALALTYFGAYQGVFAYFGLWDMVALFKAVSISAVVAGGLVFFTGFQSFPRSVFIIDWAIILSLLASLRYALRGVVRRRWHQGGDLKRKALVVGAGVGGEQIGRLLLEDPLCPYRPVGFIDETPERWGSLIHGIRVLGGAAELPLAVSANRIEAVFICASDLSDKAVQEVLDVCQQAGVEYRLVPTLSDLLGREQASGAPALRAGPAVAARQ